MTIAIAVQVHDGVVLASDSASTISDPSKPAPDNIVNVYNNANKIFNLKKGLPIGGMVFGMGSVGSSSISTLAKDLRSRFAGEDKALPLWKLDADNFTVEQIAIKVREFLFDEHYMSLGLPPASGLQLGFVVAGYSSSAQLSETWLVEIRDGKSDPPQLLIGQGITNIYAGGEPDLFSRIVNGHGINLGAALIKAGVALADIPTAISALQKEMFVQLIEAPMPIKDTIDFAEFLVNSTIQFTRFKRGAATVGGPIESCAITKHEGFKWARRKHYFDRILNPELHP
jgi:hypothetical protein